MADTRLWTRPTKHWIAQNCLFWTLLWD